MKKIYLGEYAHCDLAFSGDVIKNFLNSRTFDNFELTEKVEDADIILFTSNCACSSEAIYLSLKYFKDIIKKKKDGAEVILSGCMARKFLRKDSEVLNFTSNWINKYADKVYDTDNITPYNMLKDILEGDFPKSINSDYFGTIYSDKNVATVMVGRGCNNNCTFCKKTYQEFKLKSSKIEHVKATLDYLIEKGCRHIDLTATNIAQFGLDHSDKPLLPELIEYLEKSNLESYGLIGFAFKDGIKYGFDDLLKDSYKLSNINGSLESGSDRLLKLMNKGFTSDEFLKFMDKIRTNHPVMFDTNIIAGFPTENDDDIKRTLNVLKIVEPVSVAICGYSDSEFQGSHAYEQLEINRISRSMKTYQKVLSQRKVETIIPNNFYIYNRTKYL